MDEVQQETFMGPTNTTKAQLGLQGYGENADCTDITGFCQPFVRKENHGAETWCDHASLRCPYVTLSKPIQIKFSQKFECYLIRLLSLREMSSSCCTLPSLKQCQQCFLWSLMSTQKRILRSRGFVCLKALRNLHNNYDYSVLYLSYTLHLHVHLSCVWPAPKYTQHYSNMSGLLRHLGSLTAQRQCSYCLQGPAQSSASCTADGPGSQRGFQVVAGINQHLVSATKSLGSTAIRNNNHKLQREC